MKLKLKIDGSATGAAVTECSPMDFADMASEFVLKADLSAPIVQGGHLGPFNDGPKTGHVDRLR